jgi:hypothetical protein
VAHLADDSRVLGGWVSSLLLLWLSSCAGVALAQEPQARPSEACIADHVEGQGLRLEGRFVAAAEALKRCLDPSCSALLREDCATVLREVEAQTPTLVLAASVGARDLVEVTVRAGDRLLATGLDGRPVALDAGPIVLTFEAPGMLPAEQRIVVRAGEKNRLLAVTLMPEHPAAPAAPVVVTPAPRVDDGAARGWLDQGNGVLLGSSLVLAAVGTGLAVAAGRTYARAESTCKSGCDDEQIQRVDRLSWSADGSFALAASALVVATVRIVLSRRSAHGPRVLVGPTRVGAMVAF